MADYPTSFDKEDLLKCARGELFGPGNAQLPAPPMQWRNVSALIVATYRRPLATAGSPRTLSPKSCE